MFIFIIYYWNFLYLLFDICNSCIEDFFVNLGFCVWIWEKEIMGGNLVDLMLVFFLGYMGRDWGV